MGSSFGGITTALSLAFFAFSTILGWCYYGEKAIEYIMGSGIIIYYRILFIIATFCGSILRLETVWTFSDVMNAFMALPNLVALVFLFKVIKRLHTEYFEKIH